MVPKKDTALYGYGSVAWRNRLEHWKKEQSDRLQVMKQHSNHGGDIIEIDVNNPDFPLWVITTTIFKSKTADILY